MIIKKMHSKIIKMVKENIPKAEAAAQQMVNNFNLKLKNANSTTFMVDVLKNALFPLNMSTT